MKAGWEVKPLGEVCELKPPKKLAKAALAEDELVSFAGMSELGELQADFKEAEARPLSKVYSGYTYFADNDVLVAKITPCFENGKMGIARNLTNGIGFGSSEFVPLRLNGEITPEFLFYYLLRDKFRFDGAKVMSGAVGHKRVPHDYFLELQTPIPPLEEQKRIVAVLDAAFEGLTRAKENAEANLQNARELFESHLAFIFEHEKSSTGSTLGDAVAILTGYAFKSAEYSEDPNDMAMVRGDNIVQGQFRWKNVKRWPVARCNEFEKFRLDANDVLLAMDRTWVKGGIKYAIVSDVDLPLLLVQRVARLRCLDNLNNEYLGHFIGSKKFERYVLSIQTGMGVPHISGQQIKDCPIYLPDISVQNRLAVELSAMRLKIEALETDYRTKLNDIADLRQSLLQKAFAGELT